MSDLRKAAEQALEALEWINRVNAMDYEYQRKAQEPIQALRQALAQPEWVGLMDEDLKPLCDEWRIMYGGYVDDFAKAIEAKLKEKNT